MSAIYSRSAPTQTPARHLRARIYSDTPTRASFLDSRDEMDPSPFVDEAVAYLRSRGATEIYYLGPAGYDIWSRAE